MGTFALTGGATGIGAAVKKQLLDAGHRVIVIDLKNADVVADLSTKEGRENAIAQTKQAASDGLDGLICSAGVGSHLENREMIANVNYFGTVELTAGLIDLVAEKKGRVVLVSSNSAPSCNNPELMEAMLDGDQDKTASIASASDGQTVYAGSKQALARWMRRSVPSHAEKGVAVNAVAPGYTETAMTQAVAKDPVYGDAIKQFVKSIPIGRPGVPEDIANAVMFLLSERASFICGSVLFIDGGHDAVFRPDQF